jgi:prevent-host-death family protein
MRSITQRELRNDNAEVIRAVEAGESFLVTKNGKTVAVLRPASGADLAPGLPLGRAARRHVHYADRPRIHAAMSSEQILDELRDER